MAENSRIQRWLSQLRNRYRLVVMNDDTFEERFSLRLRPIGLLVLIGSITLVMISLVILLIAFTPLREYIPGYSDPDLRNDLDKALLSMDSMHKQSIANEIYLNNLKTILNGEDKPESSTNPRDTTRKYKKLNMRPSKDDSLLRQEFEGVDNTYSLQLGVRRSGGISGFFFFAPVKGKITSSFNMTEEHYGVDIAAPESEPVKATLDGTVISASWSPEAGYVMQLQHSNNLVSVYKHNSVLLKKTGQFIKAGEPIAIVGSSGEQSTGPHVHFELWYNGTPVDPQDYISF